jgi:hypothetical protein
VIEHVAASENNKLSRSVETASRTKLYWILAAALVYLSILVARVWGAHRFLHFEETLMIGASRTLDFGAVWDDHAYGFFLQWALSEIGSLFDLTVMPTVFVGLSVLTWLACAMWINRTLVRAGISDAVAFVGPLALCLIPLPDVAYLGMVSSIGFPILIAMVVVILVSDHSTSRVRITVEMLLLLLISASAPPALVGGGIVAALIFFKIGSLGLHLYRGIAIAAGAVMSVFVFRYQEAPMTYIGDWVPNTDYEREVFDRLTEAGGFITRERASIGIVDTIRNIPGTLRFIITQFYPEPWASRAILETGGFAKLLQVVLPLLLVVVVVAILARMRSYKIDSAVMRVALGLFLAAAMSVIVQHVLVGQLTLRQYLFLPLVFFWMAILVLFSGAVVARSGRAIFLLLPLVAVFIFAAAQNFRDPFQENPRQGGTGRYASEDLWRPALEKARVACESLEEDEVVVVSQFDPESPVIKQMIKTSGLKFAWFDHPFVARCYVINGG